MVLPESLLCRYRQECGFYASTVSRIDQRILNEFIRDGYFERYLNKMRKIYRAKHERMLQGLEAFEGKFKLSGENAGLHLLLTVLDGRTEEQLLEMAKEHQVKVYGLSDSYIKANANAATIILGYGGMTEDAITEGLERVKKAWL